MAQEEQLPLLVEYCLQQIEKSLEQFEETRDPDHVTVAVHLMPRLREGIDRELRKLPPGYRST